ncbi:DUF3173 domain-containing protein [Companilactobacillus sp.]|jgi:hypothetical protein|uniref:DUF3173 domain-containing protein n=1 Tax=Companilactobacillus sp. TaxID=2767905 RepID=UPI0025C44AB7|nr:DUF3173 domain-containing protein [Companilactobacillus sp.]MCH4009645.1 DUF3173 domain-containing protein [Companilactobacillus sp.]MCH4052679.1 DUF3173 domain-containing protein [Companilactobacillus sp.]MCH4077587.1 DUF3173 domain-containing protein [Companilactobacillus sp.]MCH4126163.1 DUF3173 domain-containing protein [Companilactobacillus sp.]MCI1311871.1 DUF3173 domain-containing protein [Companilactobacillus sp.]
MRSTIDKNGLMEMGLKEHTASTVIRQSKRIMVQRGYPFYLNRRLSFVPISVVEEILGFSLVEGIDDE